MAFGILGAQHGTMQGGVVSITILLLCFVMGLQNAVITKISGAVIRTTHVTGIATDLGRWLFCNLARNKDFVPRSKRGVMLGTLLVSFFVGGLAGAIGFQTLGYAATIPLAAALVAAAITPVLDDVKGHKLR